MKIIKNKKFIILLRLLFLIFLIINLFFHKSNINRLLSLKINKRFINDCKKSINYKRIKIINLSINNNSSSYIKYKCLNHNSLNYNIYSN